MSHLLQQPLNERLRDAQLAFYLTYAVPQDSTLKKMGLSNTLTTADDLYNFWLLDVQVSQDVPTSRVACAIASLQQYLNGITLGLEPGYESEGLSPDQKKTWKKSLHAYSVWHASQQLRHFPVTYLNPVLRNDKTDSFQQMENDINQCRIQSGTVLSAIQSYLGRFEEVANLRTINGYINGDVGNLASSVYYFVGKSSSENTYYWRSLNMAKRALYLADDGITQIEQSQPEPSAWSDWEKIPLPTSEDIPEQSIRPVCFNNRLFIIWAQCTTPLVSREEDSRPSYTTKKDVSGVDEYAQYQLYQRRYAVQFRLHFAYRKYDGSWSVPQVCINEHTYMAALNKLGADSLKGTISTLATLDARTSPPSLFLGLVANADPDNNPVDPLTNKHLRNDFFQAVRIDQHFNVTELSSLGAFKNFFVLPKYSVDADRYLSIFGLHNKSNLSFHAPLSDIINIMHYKDSTPSAHRDSSSWNYDNKQAHISSDIHAGDLKFNKTASVLEITSRVEKDFSPHKIVMLNKGYEGVRLEIKFIVMPPEGGGAETSQLLPGSYIRVYFFNDTSPFEKETTLSIRCKKTGLTFSDFLKKTAHSQPRGNKVEREEELYKHTHYLNDTTIDLDIFNHLFSTTDTHYTVDVNLALQSPANATSHFERVIPTALQRIYKQIILIPASAHKPPPKNIHRATTIIAGAAQTSRRTLEGGARELKAGRSYSAQIWLNPDTLRPYDEHPITSVPASATHQTELSVYHGVLIQEQEADGTNPIILGYALKAWTVILDKNANVTLPLGPSINRLASPKNGTAEFIDFSASSIADIDSAKKIARAPIRLNTCFAETLIHAAGMGLDTLFSLPGNTWIEPPLIKGGADQPPDFHGAYGKYYWELFLYLPWLVAHRLNLEQRYEEAESWLKYLFDPERKLKSSQSAPSYWGLHALTPEHIELSYARDNPLDPNQIALSSPSYLRQALYRLYLDILLNRGDAAFRQMTADSLTDAKHWYVRAKRLMGPQPNISEIDPWTSITLGGREN